MKYFEAFEIIIIYLGFVPSVINGILYIFPLLTILLFLVVDYRILKKYNSVKILIYVIITEICSFISDIFLEAKTGTNDNLGGLPGVFHTSFLASIFVLVAFLFLARSLYLIHKEKMMINNKDIFFVDPNNAFNNKQNINENQNINQDININNFPKND